MKFSLGKWAAAVAAALFLAAAVIGKPAEAAKDKTRYRPFVLAYTATEALDEVAAGVREKLSGAGFAVVGEYSPYEGALVIAVTNDEAKETAAKTPYGGFGAAQRVSLTQVADGVQVAYTNPVYMAKAYRMEGDLGGVATALASALGEGSAYGSKKGLTAKKLGKYRYMFGMPRFDGFETLAKYGSQQQALDAVEAGLAAGAGGTAKVYRIDLPGNGSSVFGAALSDGCSADQHVMERIDVKDPRSTGHLPYEILVSGGNVYMLHGRFRIAVNFPDLSMMGKHGFTSIMCAPGSIEDAMAAAAAGRPPKKKR